MQHTINDIVNVLIERGVTTQSEIVGCSLDEIETITRDVGQPLPLAYREFLLAMGRGMGSFYLGSEITYERLPGMSKAAHDLVTEDDAELKLPADAIPFCMHQGYQFLFMRASEGDDPPVYYYMELSGEFIRKADHLTEFLFSVAHDEW